MREEVVEEIFLPKIGWGVRGRLEVFRKFIKYGTDSSPLPTKVRKGRPTHIHAEDIWALPKWGRSKRLPGWPIASIAALKKSAPECPFECGAGGAKANWAMPKCLLRECETP